MILAQTRSVGLLPANAVQELARPDMAVVAAVRSNPVIKNVYTQLCARKKYPKSALTACMRKLLVILNAMLHNKTHWHLSAPTSSTSTFSPLLGADAKHACC